MSSFSFGGDSQLPATSPQHWPGERHDLDDPRGGGRSGAVPRTRRQRANPAALGKTWTFNVKFGDGRCGCDRHLARPSDIKVHRPATSSSAPDMRRIRASFAEEPAPPPIAFSFPSSIGCRIDFGHLDFAARSVSRGSVGDVTDSALVLDGTTTTDSFAPLTEYALQTSGSTSPSAIRRRAGWSSRGAGGRPLQRRHLPVRETSARRSSRRRFQLAEASARSRSQSAFVSCVVRDAPPAQMQQITPSSIHRSAR